MSRIAMIVVGGIAGLVAVVWVITMRLDRRRQTRRALAAARQVAIRDAVSRRAGRIAGMVIPLGERLTAPLSGRACVYYRVRVTQLRLDGTELATRSELLDDSHIVPFAVDDGTGYAAIDVSRTQMLLELDVDESSSDGARTPNQTALLARHDVASRGVIFGKDLAFEEWLIEPGERIAVAGRFVPEAGARSERGRSDPYRASGAAPPTTPRVRLVASGGAVVITDDPQLAPPLDEA